MSFMEPQITEAMDWVYVDTTQGGYYVPAEDVGKVPEENWPAKVWAANQMGLDPKDIYGVGMEHGHGARLSAPGYLDCTDWTVHGDASSAATYLLETYGEGFDEDEIVWLNELVKSD